MRPARTPTAPSPPRASAPRRWAFRSLAALGIPALLLVALELSLLGTNYGHPTSFFLGATRGGDAVLVDNTWFGSRFFPPALARSPAPVVVRARKPPGRYRIFLFGESAALGDPRPAFGPGRYLETLLRERFPQRDFEVVCVAMTAINSHAFIPIARECARLEGDLWIVYAGHNEMAGPFGATTVFGAPAPPALLIRAYLTLQRTRTGQGFAHLWRRLTSNSRTPESWGGLRMFLDQPLAPDHPLRRRVHAHFERNLEALVATGRRAGVPMLFCGPAGNLKDCAPFASQPEPRLAAEPEFQLGQELLARGESAAALRSFERARDRDALPFRADATVRGIIEAVARSHAADRVRFVDAQPSLARLSSGGVPGDEWFYDHVHLNPEGAYRLARTWAEAIEPLLPEDPSPPPGASWADAATCHQRLALTDANRIAALEEMIRRQLEPPFTQQLHHAAHLDHLRQQLADAKARLHAQSPATLRAGYEAVIRARPDDSWLHHNYAEYLTRSGDLPRAIVELQAARDLIPHHYTSHLHLGRLLARQQRFEDATQSLRRALERRPDLADAFVELGQIASTQGRWDSALEHFDAAARHRPDAVSIQLRRADVLMALKRPEAALDCLRAVIRRQPDAWEAHRLLGLELADKGHASEAQAALAEAVRLRPDDVSARLALGQVLVRLRQPAAAEAQFREALRLEPSNPTAMQALGAMERHSPATARP